MKPGFEKIDWSAPLDVDAYVGVTEGVAMSFALQPNVHIKRVSLSEAHLYTEW